MDYPSISAKIIGAALLVWTVRSIWRHFVQRKAAAVPASNPKNSGNKSAFKSGTVAKDETHPSFSEQLLNNLLLYLWLAFMLAFSAGMILNN